MIVVGLFFGFALLWLILAILIYQDYRNDKILQELKRRKKERNKKRRLLLNKSYRKEADNGRDN